LAGTLNEGTYDVLQAHHTHNRRPCSLDAAQLQKLGSQQMSDINQDINQDVIEEQESENDSSSDEPVQKQAR
jgi:predicted transglutaminase-like cysteine proteinase